MYKIDEFRVKGSVQNELLFNISEQLQELIALLKPQEVKEVKEFKEDKKFKCGCGKEFDNERQLRGHNIKCKR